MSANGAAPYGRPGARCPHPQMHGFNLDNLPAADLIKRGVLTI